jgi:hypothetical protein
MAQTSQARAERGASEATAVMHAAAASATSHVRPLTARR